VVARKPRLARHAATLVVAVALASCGSELPSAGDERQTQPQPTATPTPTPALVLDLPASTRERTVLVRGQASGVPTGGGIAVELRVNGRRFATSAERDHFRLRVTLEPGSNRITAAAELFGPDEEASTPVATVRASPARITRSRGAHDGVLNRATALWVAQGHENVYALCGEADDCVAAPSCVQMTRTRVDCPVRSQFQSTEPVVCGAVISVQVRERRLYSSAYPCGNPWRWNRRVFVREDVWADRRYRLNERRSPWLAEEVNEPNRYGLPRIDAARDVFIP